MNNKMRRHSLKRKTAFLMALSMTCSFPYSVIAEAYATDISDVQEINETVLPETENEISVSADDNEATEIHDTGMIEVTIQNLFEFANDVECNATLVYPDGAETSTQDLLISKELKESKISFENLSDGIYVLRVKAKGFATYEQAIDVQNKMLYTVHLTTGFCNGYDYETDENHPGVLFIGDVNNDGIVNDGVTENIDDSDKEILLDAISGKTTEEDYVTDLNNDGVTDLLDLEFFTKGYKEEKGLNIKAYVESSISPLNMTVNAVEGTKMDGNFAELFNNDDPTETVKLTPAEGKISEDNPVSLDIDMTQGGSPVEVEEITFQTGNDIDSLVDEGNVVIDYIDENGEEKQIPVYFKRAVAGLTESDIVAELDENGNIYINLGNQVAVKKVTLSITKLAKGSNNLVEISRVQFLNGMENRIPEPDMDKPEALTARAGSEKFDLTWNPCINVTGYEIEIKTGGKVIQTIETTLNSATISGDDIKNYITYTVSVQAVNGTWKSGYCEPVEVTPVATKSPDKPDNVKASGMYRAVKVSWANMDDTQSYNVFYRLRNSDKKYTQITGITSNSYTISELDDLAEYEIYVTGVNELGESPESIHCSATTTDLNAADMPRYRLINRDEEGNPCSAHIVDVKRYGGNMINSPLDTEDNDTTAWGAVDGDKTSYYTKAVNYDGGWNALGENGLTYTFDDAYKMDTIGVLTIDTDISFSHIKWWDEDGVEHTEWNGAWDYTNFASGRTDADGRRYYIFKLPYAITATKIQIGTGRYSAPVTVAETYFYHYDPLMSEIMDLYVDDLHTVLKDTVTQKVINNLRDKVNTPDEFGEVNPDTEALLRELETAEKILKAESLSSAVKIHNGITTKDSGRGFSGLNAWQPLGVSIGTGEEVTIYVGSDRKKTGDNTDLRLIVTQYHSESGNVVLDGANLKVGANTFKLTKGESVGAETGGALYIQYQGADTAQEKYSVRVTGGSEVPFLDLYKVTDEEERLARTVEYINKLDKYVPEIEKLHNKVHKGSGNKNLDYDYDKANCILEASDIMLDTMMYSLPAQQILAGAGKGTVEERAKTILKSMEATEEMMYLFYQHKGLNANAPEEINQIPKGHQNIRYQRMFSGAFMYASGNHIGIEWDSVPAMMQGVPIESTEDGKYVSGNYYGWGISHEIGHCINQGDYAVAEITNNYFAQLGQSQDKNDGMRFQYQNIYDKVTSGTKGNCSNIATQLGMYWQLHIAYDKGLNFKTYADYEEQLANIFYARVDTYSRNPESAPAPEKIALTLDGDSDQKLMRLACAAAEKNILEFFERWGKTPDSETIKYASQFEKETRAIQYANDDSRVYALSGKGSVLGTESAVSVIKDVSINTGKSANMIDLAFTSADIPASDILGYEVIRCTTSGGQVEEVPVGFTTGTEFTDTVTTLNNRTVFYKITLIDQYLNRSAVYTTDMVKIEHDGSLDKTNWTINTTGLEAESVVHDATDEMPCEQTKENPAEQVLDNNLNTVYTPQVTGDSAEIVIDFNQTLTVSGLKYTAGEGDSIGDYEVYVMEDGEWISVSQGAFKGSKTVYFANSDDKYISTYSATAVKLVINGQDKKKVSIAELDVLGVTGDNVDFRRTETDSTAVIGTLGEDYRYGENKNEIIPKDSLVFTGSYKGNPAYNVVVLYDLNGNIVGGLDADENTLSHQIILADVPDGSDITNVSDGTWLYWIEPDDMKNMTIPETVRVELYRVNNALTNEGQRLVSDSLPETVPDKLPVITLNGNEK